MDAIKMAHKDSMGQDINPDDIVAYAPAKQSSGFRYGIVVGETAKSVKVAVRWSIDQVRNRPHTPGEYSSALAPHSLLVINKLMP